MIGVAARLILGDSGGCCIAAIAAVGAVLAVCGIYRCLCCRMRDYGCMKNLLRATGVDLFDDFELTLIVHQAFFTSKTKRFETKVKVKAGMHEVETEPEVDGTFHQPLEVMVEQGTEKVIVELIDVSRSAVCAKLIWDPARDILNVEEHHPETIYALKQTSREVLNPRLKMSLYISSKEDVEKALLPDLNVSVETNLMLNQQIKKVMADEDEEGKKRSKPLSELELLAKGTAGPLDIFETWGSTRTIWLGVRGPPEARRYRLGIWETKDDDENGKRPEQEVDMLKVLSVSPDPSRSDVFTLTFVDNSKIKQRLTFRRVDRNRDVWVEMLRALIEMIRAEKDKKRRK